MTRRLYGWECLTPEARVLTADLRWVPAEAIKVGEPLIGCTEEVPQGAHHRPLRVQTVTERRVFVAPLIDVTLVDGRRTRVSTNHPFLAQHRIGRGGAWVQAQALVPGMFVKALPVWDWVRTYEAGMLRAFLDGEGHLAQGWSGTFQLLISQAKGPLAEEIVDLWTNCGFPVTFKWLRHKKRPWEKPVATSGVLCLPEVLRALGSIRPSRLLRRFVEFMAVKTPTLRSIPTVEIASVEPAGEGPVIGLTTDPDHTLIADGIVGHNTNSYSRPLMIDAGRRVINTGQITIHEEKLIEELSNFSMMDNGKYEAEYGHDDRCVALLIALRSREENYVEAKLGPTLSDVHPFDGIRVVDHRDVTVDAGKRADRIFKRVKDAVTSYLEL